MNDIFPKVQEWLAQKKKVALATVVKTWGSAPREIGSVMAISEEGEMCGSVSGGCVETAVIEEALQVITAQKPRLLSYGVTNEEAWTVGLACGGTIEILVRTFESGNLIDKRLIDLITNEKTGALVTYTGPEPDMLGRQMLLEENESAFGLIDEAEIDVSLRKMIDFKNPPRQARSVELFDKTLFIQPVLPLPRFIMIGGVHIAQPLAGFAKALGFEAILIDPRTAFANAARFPEIDKIVNLWPDEALSQIGIDTNTFIVLLTHDPKIDDPGIIAALNAHPAYIGVLGSRRTHEKRVKRLTEAGLKEQQISRLYAPIGLSIGARSPAEIAMSIMAEVVSVQRMAGNG